MSILIKGMEMPSGCISCDFCNPFTDEPYCRRLMRKTPKVTRLKDCPLVEVPPHGPLIDWDELSTFMYHHAFELDSADQRWDSGCWIRYRLFENAMKAMPTIIEAEEE